MKSCAAETVQDYGFLRHIIDAPDDAVASSPGKRFATLVALAKTVAYFPRRSGGRLRA
jgi:hypothetical protein